MSGDLRKCIECNKEFVPTMLSCPICQCQKEDNIAKRLMELELTVKAFQKTEWELRGLVKEAAEEMRRRRERNPSYAITSLPWADALRLELKFLKESEWEPNFELVQALVLKFYQNAEDSAHAYSRKKRLDELWAQAQSEKVKGLPTLWDHVSRE